MSPVPERIADPQDKTNPSTRIAEDLRSTVLDSLGRLRSLTANVTIAGLDEATEKLLQSVQRLRSLQGSVHRVASIKSRLMNVEGKSVLETSKQPVKKFPPGNLIPFPGLTKRLDASEPKVGLLRSQDDLSETQSSIEQAPARPSNEQQPDIGRPLNSFEPTLSDLTKVTKQLESLLAEIGKKKEPRVAAKEHFIAAKEAGPVVSDNREQQAAQRQDEPLALQPFTATGTAAVIANSDPPTILNAGVTPEGPVLSTIELGPKGQLNDVIVAAENPAAQQNAPMPPAFGTVDREIRELVKAYGRVDKYAANKNNGILGKVTLAGCALHVFLAASYLLFSNTRPGQNAAQVAHSHEFTTVAARKAVILPVVTKSDQPNYLGGSGQANAPAAQPQASGSQDHPIKAIVPGKPIERVEAKISANPRAVIVPATQQWPGPQSHADELNP